MRTMESWLSEYRDSHQNKTNQMLHRICVPSIFFSILGMLWCWQIGSVNGALVAVVLCLPFYIRLGSKALALILPQVVVTLGVLYAWNTQASLNTIFYSCLAIFVVAWIGQFIGHKIEGKKPSFFKDLQFLLVGPLWIFKG